MSLYEETADVIIRNLNQMGWGKGGAWGTDGHLHSAEGPWCLGMACPVFTDDVLNRLLEIIGELYPGRGSSEDRSRLSIPRFNDHPDTTFEDIELVVKHLRETK